MKRRDLFAILGAAITRPGALWAQTTRKRPLIGYLSPAQKKEFARYTSAFLEGMHELGYVDGQTVDIVYRFADDDPSRLTAQAQEMASLKPDVIVAADPPAAIAAKRATSSIPVVAAMLQDPVNQGLVASYARLGGNLTGILIAVQGLNAKQFEVLRELIPTATAIGLLRNPSNPASVVARHEIESAGAATRVKVVTVEAAAAREIGPAFNALIAANVQAVFVIGDPMFSDERKHIEEIALAAHLPTMASARLSVEAGFLVSYGVNYFANERRVAYFVDKILKGAKPADLPVEFPTKIEMVVNMTTAKALGITIPQSILVRADDEIE